MNTSTTMSSSTSRTVTVVDPKMSLSLWLRTGRAHKGLSLADVAKITKIQSRILERLEAGKLEGLPAEVFVRGFVRSYARCVGLDEGEALQRYSLAAGQALAPTASARALVESMSELAPNTATRAPKLLRRDPEINDVAMAHAEMFAPVLASGSLPDLQKSETVVEMLLPEMGTIVSEPAPAPVIETAMPVVESPVIETVAAPILVTEAKPSSKKKKGKGRGKRKAIATGTPFEPTPVVEAAASDTAASTTAVDETTAAPEPMELAEGSTATSMSFEPIASDVTESAASSDSSDSSDSSVGETWAPKMPTVVSPSVPWRRPYASSTSVAAIVPTIVIDDADPDSAERELEDRAASKEPARRSFLPPILMDREDRSARQGGLTLAVIILLIAATLTLSYLMRRPSSTGDGVTQAEAAHDILA